MKNAFYVIVGILIIALFVGCTSCTAGCGKGYSDGERVGLITKFSHKGVIYKSWEGELNLGGTVSNGENGVVPSTWTFTVTDPAMVSKVKTAMDSGKKVKCHYVQWFFTPIAMDSSYELTAIEVLP